MTTKQNKHDRNKNGGNKNQIEEYNKENIFIKQIILQNYRSFKYAKINLFELKSAIIGPNSAGKSNIIDAIQFCLCARQLEGDLSEYVNSKSAKEDLTSVELETSNKQCFKRVISNNTISYFINKKTVNQEVYTESVKETFRIETNQSVSSLLITQKESHMLNINFISKLLENEEAFIREYDEANKNYNDAVTDVKTKNAKLLLQKKKVQNFATDEEVLTEQTEISQQLTKCQYQHSLIQLYSIQKQIEQILQENVKLETQLSEINDGNYQQTRDILSQTQNEIQQLYSQLQQFQLNKQQLQNQINMQITPATKMENSNVEIAKRQLQNAQHIVNNKTLDQTKLTGQIKDLEKEEQEISKKLKQFQQDGFEIPAVFFEKQQQFQQENQQLLSSLQEVEYNFKKQQQELEKTQAKIDTLQQRQQASESQLETIMQSIKEKDQMLKNETSQCDEYSKEIDTLEQQIKENKLKITRIMQNLQQLNSTLANNTEYQRLINHEKRYQQVMDRIKSDVIHGYVYNLFKVKNSQYQEVIDFISSGFKYSVVCQNFNSVQNVVERVKQNKIQLQFLPLSKFQTKDNDYDKKMYELNALSNKCHGISLEPILNLIEFDYKYSSAFVYIFNNIFLIKNQNFESNQEKVNQINAFCRANNVRAVSLNNVIYSGKGVIQYQVVSQNRQSNQQTSKNIDIEQLSRNKIEFEKQLEELESKMVAAQTRQQIIQNNQITLCKKNMDAIQSDIQKLIEEKDIKKKQQDIIKANIEHYNSQLQDIEKEMKSYKQQIDDLDHKIFGLELNFYEKYKLSKDIIEKAQFQTKEKDALSAKLKKVQITHAQKKNLWNQLEQDIKSVNQFISDTTEKQSQYQQTINKLNAQSQELQLRIDNAQKQVVLKTAELQRKKIEERELQNQLQETAVRKLNIEQQLSRQNALKDQKNELLLNVLEAVYVNGIALRSATDVSGEIAAYLAKESDKSPYELLRGIEIDYRDVKEILKGVATPKSRDPTSKDKAQEDEAEALSTYLLQLCAQIDQCQLKLNSEAKVGVSLAIINAEKEKLKKYEDDVREAKRQLQRFHQVLGQKSEARRVAFAARLDEFRNIFTEVYHLLTDFQGQVVVTEVDPLKPFLDDCLDLVVQPPGDKINKPSELSGGEQALVRFALTLSVARLNGQSLLLLDEVDQNLDADRVNKVQKMLNEQENMQILAVTHNASFATFADQLVGVSKGQVFWIQISPNDVA